MIRELTSKDQKQTLEYLYQEPSINIFIIGDIEQYGMATSFQKLYGEFEDDMLISVLLFYRLNVIYYAKDNHFNLDYLPIIKAHDFQFLSGARRCIDLIIPHLPKMKAKPMYFAQATSIKHWDDFSDLDIVLLSTEQQATELYDMLQNIDEFSVDRETKEQFVEGKMNSIKTGPTLMLYENNQLISTVAATAETKLSAMVVAVATKTEHRQKGYASKLMTCLMDLYLNQKEKYLCLFYDNPKAGAIYKRLGFEDIDQWIMYTKE